MYNNYVDINSSIKKEADHILYEQGLLKLLEEFGEPKVSGSYSLDLMTWRDLDIYLVTANIKSIDFFKLGSGIHSLLNPIKMSFRNETIANTSGLPYGLYWGVYLGDERKGAWKIDVWAVEKKEYDRLDKFFIQLKNQLTADHAQTIMEIKSQCWQHPQYRKSFSSMDIYKAVLENNVITLEGFISYLKDKN
jgi:hypothetical protein